MPTSGYVQLPSDAPDNKNKVASYSVIDDAGNTVLEQVSVLADVDGNIVGVVGNSVQVVSDTLSSLLTAIVRRLDVIAATLDSEYNPDDNLGII